jgi:pimeloyl-ACP methyl ester carboxylesterase
MRTQQVVDPVPWKKAFQRHDRPAVLSQAALLLSLSDQVRRHGQALALARVAGGGRKRAVSPPLEEEKSFPVPRVRLTGAREGVEAVRARLTRRYGKKVVQPRRPVKATAEPHESLPDLAARLGRTASLGAAADLMEACLIHGLELTRIAAAIAYFDVTSEPGRLLAVLAEGARSADELARDVAATALARVAPEHPRLAKLVLKKRRRRRGRRAHTALLIHGTWARSATWWQPGGDFHSYLLGSVRPDLYSAADRFEWSGGWSDGARAIAASDLRAWVTAHGLNGLDLFTHSHGGSVAMLASQGGLDVGELVLLSCPVHPQYMPDFSRVGKTVSIRVHLDLVILADGGGQRFHDSRIQENVLPVWFDHAATHDPAVWQQHNVPAKL